MKKIALIFICALMAGFTVQAQSQTLAEGELPSNKTVSTQAEQATPVAPTQQVQQKPQATTVPKLAVDTEAVRVNQSPKAAVSSSANADNGMGGTVNRFDREKASKSESKALPKKEIADDFAKEKTNSNPK